MPISECCNTNVVSCGIDASVFDVGELMRKHHVGTVVVTSEQDRDRVPIGIITDRDIVLEMVALRLDVSVFTAGDVMSAPVITVRQGEGVVEALRLMRSSNIRRLPVVTETGALYGIVTADDLLKLLAMELSLMTSAIADQQVTERRLRRGDLGDEGARGASLQ